MNVFFAAEKSRLAEALSSLSGHLWQNVLIYLLLGAGLFFVCYSRFVPFLYVRHSLALLRGKYNDPKDPGQINHFQALCSALAGTVGMGNVSGVAAAILAGGPGAVFWMWVCAVVGMGTKFFTCTSAVLFRGKDDTGEVQGGPMYVITEGLGRDWKPLAVMFSVFGMFGALPLFQSNQLTSLVRSLLFEPRQMFIADPSDIKTGNALIGGVIAILVALVIWGGIRRIGKVASWLVPGMVLLYGVCALVIIGQHLREVPAAFGLIFRSAFSGSSVAGGALGTVIMIGVRRGAFSNEAGLGTEVLAHGAARTKEPVREGLVAMLGPFIDTIVVCTLTALMIITTGVWKKEDEGILMTKAAFVEGFNPTLGPLLLLFCVLFISFSSMITYSYYVTKCAAFLFGTRCVPVARLLYLTAIVLSAVVGMGAVLDFLDIMLGMMAFPTLLSALLLSPKVMAEARRYFARLKAGEFEVTGGGR